MTSIDRKTLIALVTLVSLLTVIVIGVQFFASSSPTFWSEPKTETPATSGTDEPFRISAIRLDSPPENVTYTTVNPLPDPVGVAVENANNETDLHSDSFSYLAVSRDEFRTALRPFYGEPLPEMTPKGEVYYLKRHGAIYRIHFDVLVG